MTEFRHPPIDTNILRDTTLEQDFAERAYEILSQYAVSCTSISGDNELIYPVTDRADMISTVPDTEFALRLIRTPVFAMSKPEGPAPMHGAEVTADQSSTEYIVLQLQYGTLEFEDSDEVIDTDFEWHPYVMSIASSEDDIHIVNPENGRGLDATDIMQASYFMELMAKELRGILLETAMYGNDEIPVYHESLKDRYEPLPQGEALNLNTSCPECGKTNSLCVHDDVARNNPVLN